MSRMLSTFSNEEHSRFEAHERCSLDARAIREWLAACISHKHSLLQKHTLTDLVMPGQDSDITIVVATLAKIYAQRLVVAAVQMRDASQATSSLQPTDILRAYHYRRDCGLDPGFLLAPHGSFSIAVNGQQDSYTTNDHEQRRLAAFEAQDEYDKYMLGQAKERDDVMQVKGSAEKELRKENEASDKHASE
jgi:hypothetical protein